MHWMSDKSGPPHSSDAESQRRNWKNPCMTCATKFYMWRCSSNVLDHLLLGIIFPLSFTSHPLDLLSRWVLKLQIQGCTGHVSGAMTLPLPSAWKRIRMSFWESRVPLRMAGTEKAWNTGVSCPWTVEKLLTGSVEESPGRAEHRLTQGTKVKRQIHFLEEFPVQIRKLGVEMVRAVPGVRRLSLH